MRAISILFILLTISCAKEDARFNFSSFSEEEMDCFQNNFAPINSLTAEAQNKLNTSPEFYISGKLVNKLQGINHDFFMMNTLNSTTLKKLEGVQYISDDPDINLGSSNELTSVTSIFDLTLTEVTEYTNKFGFGFHLEFTPQEVGDFNSLYDSFFKSKYLNFTSSKQYTREATKTDRKGFQLSFLMGCSGVDHPNGARQFWMPADGNKVDIGKILSYERINNRDSYTYLIKIDISGKLYEWGVKAENNSYFADIENGILFMKFDQNK